MPREGGPIGAQEFRLGAGQTNRRGTGRAGTKVAAEDESVSLLRHCCPGRAVKLEPAVQVGCVDDPHGNSRRPILPVVPGKGDANSRKGSGAREYTQKT